MQRKIAIHVLLRLTANGCMLRSSPFVTPSSHFQLSRDAMQWSV
jgi:hypothetical protein